jgi:hypothetical protein
MIAGTLRWKGLIFTPLNPLFEIVCIADLVMVSVAVYYLCVYRLLRGKICGRVPGAYVVRPKPVSKCS